LSQRALAARAHVRQPAISRIESGRQEPTLATLSRLVEACGQELRLRVEDGIDRHELGLLETTLALTPEQRIDRLVTMHKLANELRNAVQRHRRRS
jgi:transcriptional regulator with XRE-family HTH domain